MSARTIDLGRVVGPQGPQGEQAPVDASPTSGSANAVSSGGTYTALQGKQDKITGAASTVTSNNMTTNKVLVSDGNGKINVSSVTDDELERVSVLGDYIEERLEGTIDAFAQQTTAISIAIPTQNGSGGTWMITGWLEIRKPPIEGRYGAQIHEEPYGGTDVAVEGAQNYYDYPTGGGNSYVGWNLTHIAVVEGMSPVQYHLNLLATPASESNTVRISRAELRAVRIK